MAEKTPVQDLEAKLRCLNTLRESERGPLMGFKPRDVSLEHVWRHKEGVVKDAAHR